MHRAPRIALALVAVVLVFAAVPASGPAQPKPLKSYTLILDFVPTGEYIRTTPRWRRAGTGTKAST